MHTFFIAACFETPLGTKIKVYSDEKYMSKTSLNSSIKKDSNLYSSSTSLDTIPILPTRSLYVFLFANSLSTKYSSD